MATPADQFLQYAQLRQQNNQQLSNDIGDAANLWAQIMMKREANASALREKEIERAQKSAEKANEPEAILAKALQLGPESLTAEERSKLDAFQQLKSAERRIDPLTGQVYSPYEQINIGGVRASNGQPSNIYEGILPPRIDGGEDTNEAFQKLSAPSPIGYKDEGITKGVSSNILQSPAIQMEKAKAGVEVSKEEQISNAKEEREKRAKEFEAKKAMKVLDDMEGYNAKTLGMSYAGAVQPATRILNEEAAQNMALLKQSRLRLAAPLAKQLGVNPTDKDFQNTLDQIFDENENKETRAAMIEAARKLISGDIEGSEFYNEINGVGPRDKKSSIKDGQTATNPKTGEKMIFKDGAWKKM